MDKISWSDRIRNLEVLQRVKEERNILQTIKRRMATWIGHVLRRNCLLMGVIEGNIEERIEVTGKSARKRKQLLGDLREKRWYCQFKEEALDNTLWRTRFRRGYGSVVWQTTKGMNLLPYLQDSWTVRSVCCRSEYVNILPSLQNIPAIRRSTILRAVRRSPNTSGDHTWDHFCLLSNGKIASAGLWHGKMAWEFHLTHPNGGPRTLCRQPNRQWLWCRSV